MNQEKLKESLEKIGFIIDRDLQEGKNKVRTQYKPNSVNGVVTIYGNTVSCFAFDGSVETTKFTLNESIKPGVYIKTGETQEDRKVKAINAKKEFDALVALAYCPTSAYKVNKLIHDDHLVVNLNGSFAIPIFNFTERTVQGIQYIYDNGFKKLKGVVSNGGYPITNRSKLDTYDTIYLTEGYATGSSVYQATNQAVVVCFGCSNVDNVYNILRAKYPDKQLIVIKDNDPAGLKIKSPGFTVGDESNGFDANDVHVKYGLDELRKRIFEGMISL